MTGPIFILAGEASGDLLASRIMRAVNTNYGQQKWIGLGGNHMTARGLESVGEMHRLSLIGCLLYTSPSPRDKRQSRMPSSA